MVLGTRSRIALSSTSKSSRNCSVTNMLYIRVPTGLDVVRWSAKCAERSYPLDFIAAIMMLNLSHCIKICRLISSPKRMRLDEHFVAIVLCSHKDAQIVD